MVGVCLLLSQELSADPEVALLENSGRHSPLEKFGIKEGHKGINAKVKNPRYSLAECQTSFPLTDSAGTVLLKEFQSSSSLHFRISP